MNLEPRFILRFVWQNAVEPVNGEVKGNRIKMPMERLLCPPKADVPPGGRRILQVIEIADTLAAFAAATANADLTARVELTRSGLAKLSDDNLEETSRRIETAASAHLTALADYSVTQAAITALGTARVSFATLKTAPRTVIAGRVGATATLPDLFDSANRPLRKRLDKLVTRFRWTEAEFTGGYSAARQILNRGGRSSEPATPTPVPVPAPTPA